MDAHFDHVVRRTGHRSLLRSHDLRTRFVGIGSIEPGDFPADVLRRAQNFQRAGGTEHAEFEVYYNLGRAFIEHAKPDLGVQYLRQSFTLEPNAYYAVIAFRAPVSWS